MSEGHPLTAEQLDALMERAAARELPLVACSPKGWLFIKALFDLCYVHDVCIGISDGQYLQLSDFKAGEKFNKFVGIEDCTQQPPSV
jgi:hypothetical protein